MQTLIPKSIHPLHPSHVPIHSCPVFQLVIPLPSCLPRRLRSVKRSVGGSTCPCWRWREENGGWRRERLDAYVEPLRGLPSIHPFSCRLTTTHKRSRSPSPDKFPSL